jgi:hypothetical protein
VADPLADLCTAMQLLEQSGNPAARRTAGALRAWLADRDRSGLEAALGLPERSRKRWRDAQRLRLLSLAALATRDGLAAGPWRRAELLSARIAALPRDRSGDLAARLLRRAAELGPLPERDRLYRLLVSSPLFPPVSAAESAPMNRAHDSREQLQRQVALCAATIDRLVSDEAELDELTADLRPFYAELRGRLTTARREWAQDLTHLSTAGHAARRSPFPTPRTAAANATDGSDADDVRPVGIPAPWRGAHVASPDPEIAERPGSGRRFSSASR